MSCGSPIHNVPTILRLRFVDIGSVLVADRSNVVLKQLVEVLLVEHPVDLVVLVQTFRTRPKVPATLPIGPRRPLPETPPRRL